MELDPEDDIGHISIPDKRVFDCSLTKEAALLKKKQAEEQAAAAAASAEVDAQPEVSSAAPPVDLPIAA